MNLSDKGLDLIKEFEGLRLEAYQPVAGDRWTIGYGTTLGVKEGDSIDLDAANRFLKLDVVKFERCVNISVTHVQKQNEFDACVCLAYNIGCAAFSDSTLVKMANTGNLVGAANQFLRWDKFRGKPLAGLSRRRERERKLFLGET
jgi:lysozyme